MPKLNTDKISGNKKTVYGKAGTHVTIVKDYGYILIVEANGNKFSVKKSELDEQPNKITQ